MAEDHILKLRQVTKRYPGTLAVDNVNLSVRRGEVHSIMGENGAGKSTLMKILVFCISRNGAVMFNLNVC
ncbi:MAG: ATP-binding cassette domain-containing protein [Planctomycetes bacterium]|nr:ATP-binding cassette domain-containing protein [Planctomycetota bacterium]